MTALRQRTKDKEQGTGTPGEPKRILVIWGNWGPYHYARFRGFREAGKQAGYDVHGLELFPSSGHYDWEVDRTGEGVHHLNIGPEEYKFHPWRMTRLVLPKIASLRPDVVFVPSYWHWSLYINLFARLIGSRVVMMNESHGGTEKATGWRKVLKKAIVRRFHAALVGGTPHKEYFSSLGLDPDRIFPGYDAVDNNYFSRKANEARAAAPEWRERLGLPGRYFLSLGRMVEKKNLSLLIEAYAEFLDRNPDSRHHLVFVGSGEEETPLRKLCTELSLRVEDHQSKTSRDAKIVLARSHARAVPGTGVNSPVGDYDFIAGGQNTAFGESGATFKEAEKGTGLMTEPAPSSAVHFFGFRQIDQNPMFYALADAFILPSRTEEWGLVVNEAMACGLPVLVCRNVGCADDLVEAGANGFLFDSMSPEELADHLETLAHQPDRRKEMGWRSSERIAQWGCDNFARNGIRAADAALEKR